MKKIITMLIIAVLLSFISHYYSHAAVNTDDKKVYLNLEWWEKFKDPILETYLVKAYNENHDLKIASTKIKEAQQVVRQSLAQEMPQIDFLGNLDRTFRSSTIKFGDVIIPEYSQYQFTLPLTMNYEIDLWGKNRLKTKSAEQQLEILKQNERAVYISLTSALASDYYNLVKTDKMLEYQNQIVSMQKNILTMTEAKYKSGLTSIIDVNNERKNLTVANSEKNSLEERKSILTNQIKALLSIPQSEKLDRISFDKIPSFQLPAQINSEIIQNRPDFMIAEDQLKKLGIDVKIAKKELLPSFFITGQIGFNSYEWSNMFDWKSFVSSLGVVPFWDVFTGGKRRALLKLKKYQYEEARHYYEKTVLSSFQEVNDSLVSAKTAQKNYGESIERLNLENENYNLVHKKYQIGGTSKLESLKSNEALLISEKLEVSNKINCIISSISLYKAIGGKDFSSLNKNESL